MKYASSGLRSILTGVFKFLLLFAYLASADVIIDQRDEPG
jgi:hypothetical protein